VTRSDLITLVRLEMILFSHRRDDCWSFWLPCFEAPSRHVARRLVCLGNGVSLRSSQLLFVYDSFLTRTKIFNGLALFAISMHPRFSMHKFAGPAIAGGGIVFSGSIMALVLWREKCGVLHNVSRPYSNIIQVEVPRTCDAYGWYGYDCGVSRITNNSSSARSCVVSYRMG
jgi:hypothetical protein